MFLRFHDRKWRCDGSQLDKPSDCIKTIPVLRSLRKDIIPNQSVSVCSYCCECLKEWRTGLVVDFWRPKSTIQALNLAILKILGAFFLFLFFFNSSLFLSFDLSVMCQVH